MNLTTLTSDVLFLSNTVLAQYPQDAIIRNLNYYYDEVVTEIWKAENSWKFDKGEEGLPIAVTDLVANQRDYQIPSDARIIERVEILENNKPIILEPIVLDDAPADDITQVGIPYKYYVKGRSLYLFPASKENKENSLIVYLSRSVVPLELPTDEPKIDREFQRYLSVGASLDFYFSKGNINKSREMERKLETYKVAIKDFYSSRNRDYKARFKPRRQSYL